MLCPIIFNSNTIELTVHTSCYCGLRLTLCYNFLHSDKLLYLPLSNFHGYSQTYRNLFIRQNSKTRTTLAKGQHKTPESQYVSKQKVY